MKLLVDMNLSPEWIALLEEAGFEAVHWSAIGDSKAADEEILAWAKANRHVFFTHDLDFGAILASSKANSPSVLQLRIQDVNPHHIRQLVVSVLRQFEAELTKGALISVDQEKSRARILPIVV
jgi:predicted nuclease of predicted toxin-antitoxin system